MWRCAACGEENEPPFDACWKCGAEGPPPGDRPPPVIAPPPVPAAPRVASAGRLIGRSLLDLLLSMALVIAVVIPALAGGTALAYVFALLLTQPGLLAMACWRRRRMARVGEPVAPLWEGGWSRALLVGLPLGAFMAALGVFYAELLKPLGVAEASPWYFGESPFAKLLMFFLGIVLAPIGEEAFFRGTMLGAFSASGRRGLGLFCSGVLFAPLHVTPSWLPYYFVLSFLLGSAFLGTRSIRAPAIAHAVANALILAFHL